MRKALALLCLLGLTACGPQTAAVDYETLVKAKLRDPASAQFSDVTVNVHSACGFVNSKNGFGGYAGKVPFFAMENDVRIFSEPTAKDSAFVNAGCLDPAKSKINEWMTDHAIAVLQAGT